LIYEEVTDKIGTDSSPEEEESDRMKRLQFSIDRKKCLDQDEIQKGDQVVGKIAGNKKLDNLRNMNQDIISDMNPNLILFYKMSEPNLSGSPEMNDNSRISDSLTLEAKY
jgi:hypothetical protein